MSNNTKNAPIELANYETRITGFVTGVVAQKEAVETVRTTLYSVAKEHLSGLTLREFNAVAKECNARLKKLAWADNSVDMTLSTMRKLISANVELPETWSDAKRAAQTVRDAEAKEAEAKGEGDKRRKPRQPVAKESEAGDSEAQDVTANPPTADDKLADVRLSADPAGKLLLSIKAKLANLHERGASWDVLELALVNALAAVEETIEQAEALEAMIEHDAGEPGDDAVIGQYEADAEIVEQREAA